MFEHLRSSAWRGRVSKILGTKGVSVQQAGRRPSYGPRIGPPGEERWRCGSVGAAQRTVAKRRLTAGEERWRLRLGRVPLAGP